MAGPLWHRLEEVPEFSRWFEGCGEEWRLRIEEELADDTMVIRAELPDIDPDNDVEITVADGVLNLRAERRCEKTEEETGRKRYGRSPVRSGCRARTQRRRRQGELQGRHRRSAVPVQGAHRGRGARGPDHQVVNPPPTRACGPDSPAGGLGPPVSTWPPHQALGCRESVRADTASVLERQGAAAGERAPGLSPLPYALVTVAL